jgi:hypothetical protein
MLSTQTGDGSDAVPLEAPIVAVTVYLDAARVTRRGTVTLPGGSSVVTIADLPASLQEDSVRVAAHGDGLTLTAVEVSAHVDADDLRAVAASAHVVRLGLPRTTPAIPSSPMSRSTVQRATVTPSRRSCRHTLRAPYTPRLVSNTRRIWVFSSLSRIARGDGGRLLAA